MKILFVIPYFYPALAFGGSVRVTYDVGKKLTERGHEVTVFTSDAKNWRERLTVQTGEVERMKVYYFRNTSMFLVKNSNLFITPELFNRIRLDLKSFDIIHIHEYTTFQNILVHRFAKKYDVPYVLQVHGSLPKIGRTGRKWLYDVLFGRRLLRDASKVIALSQVEAEQYRRVGVPDEDIAIIPNGIDLSEYSHLPLKGSFKRKFNILGNKKIILYLGRINKTKGIDFLIKAYAYMIKTMKCDNTMLVIAGPDDGYLVEAKRLTNSLEISNEVKFTRMLSEKEGISAYVDAIIVVNVEPKNVFGLVPLESAACSTPVIVSEGNAISNVVRQGRFGFSVKYDDAYELAETMKKMLNDNVLLREMSQKGRKFVFENFNWTDKIVKLEKVYEDVTKRSRCISIGAQKNT